MNKLLRQKLAIVMALMIGVEGFYAGSPEWLLKASEIVAASENVQQVSYVSPEVNGSNVTFRYYTTTPSTIQVKGSFDEKWGKLHDLTDEDGNGVYEYTLKNLPNGPYEYGFMINGKW